MKPNFLDELISYASKDHSAKSELILRKCGTFLEIIEAPEELISELVGDDGKCSFYLKLCAAIASRRLIDRFAFGKRHTEEEIREYLCAKLFGLPEENVYMISLDAQGRCVSADRVGEGIVNFSSVLPRKVIDVAKRHGAKSVVLAHNHPGGALSPSGNDVAATEILSEFLHSAEITLERSYVVSGMEWVEIKK